ncbi:MAG: rhodanese-like domain-containing protein [Rhodospirillales bacterium]|nr:rhodanese-like domain-containing protein [Rhodospirillales bacterium]
MSKVKHVDCATLKQWIDNDEAIIIDVREVSEYEEAHIKGAILIPVGTCSPAAVPHNPDKKIVFHCKAGIRGGKACEVCAKAMPEGVVYNLEGGLDRWISEGYPVQRR